jgi:hypothetical protein
MPRWQVMYGIEQFQTGKERGLVSSPWLSTNQDSSHILFCAPFVHSFWRIDNVLLCDLASGTDTLPALYMGWEGMAWHDVACIYGASKIAHLHSPTEYFQVAKNLQFRRRLTELCTRK